MKTFKSILLRLIPVLILAVSTVIMSINVYSRTMKKEEEECWERLDISTVLMAEKIAARFNDNLNLLARVADGIDLENGPAPLDSADGVPESSSLVAYLHQVRQNTMFKRLDIIFPDNTVMRLQDDGTADFREKEEGQQPFNAMIAKGPHISPRIVDSMTGGQVLYCLVPIITDGVGQGLLVGVVDCDDLSTFFSTYVYEEDEATLFIVDRTNGDFLLNTWDEDLDNIYTMEHRPVLSGYEDVNFKADILSGDTGVVAFAANSEHSESYMYYTRIDGGGYYWQVCLMVQEDVVFSSLEELQDALASAGLVLIIISLWYILWNVIMIVTSVKNGEKARAAAIEEEKNKAKEQFLSTVSHDIRTPLNGILGMVDVIKRHKDDPARCADAVKKIESAARYLETMASDVLDLNEIENKKIVLRDDPINLHAFIEELSFVVQPRIEETGLLFLTDCRDVTHAHVRGSSIHLHRVLLNLLTNAIKYNVEGGEIRLTVEETGEKDGRALFRFIVADTGIGMSEEFQKTMFEAFEQEHAEGRGKYLGHGLGLSIVKQLTEHMGGRVHVKSHMGEGTTFAVELPLDLDTDGTKETPATDISGMHLLLAEDNDLNMEIAATLLRELGATVDTVTDGAAAVAAFSAASPGTYNAILMDIMMPTMDGYEATRAIRSLGRADAATVPIIAMTAAAAAGDIARCREAGMNGYIPKPLDIPTMLAKIGKYKK